MCGDRNVVDKKKHKSFIETLFPLLFAVIPSLKRDNLEFIEDNVY